MMRVATGGSPYINNDQGWRESVLQELRDGALSAPLAEGEAYDEHGYTANEVQARRARQAGDIIKENVEGLLDPDQYADEYGTDQPRELARVAFDIGSLWRVDWTEIGASFLADLDNE